jgi:excisionase family DNA binding protein
VEGRADRSTAKSRATHRRTFGNREGGVKAQGGEVIDLLTIEEVAERLRVSVLTVRWLRQEGRFAPAIKVGRRLVWDARDVAAWLESQRESTEVA